MFCMEIWCNIQNKYDDYLYTCFGQYCRLESVVIYFALDRVFHLFCWYPLRKKKRESLPFPKLLNQQNYLTHSALSDISYLASLASLFCSVPLTMLYRYRTFSHDVTTAILVSQNNESEINLGFWETPHLPLP